MSWEDPADGMLNVKTNADGDLTYTWEDDTSGCWVGCLIVLLSTAIMAGLVAGLAWWLL